MVPMLEHAMVVNALRSALLLAGTLLAMPILRRAASSTRRLVLALGITAALVVPVFSGALPAWRVPAPSLALPVPATIPPEPAPVPGHEIALAPAPALKGATRVSPTSHVDWAAWIPYVWALGALLLLARLAASLTRARAMKRRATPAPGWERACARAERATGVHVEVRETSELDAPAVCGVLSPVILVPRSAADWDEQRRNHVLLHEMAHVRRHDCLVQAVAELAVALHWFDPLAWLCARRLRLEREIAADDAALERGARPSSYAEDLLAISGALPAPAATLGMGEPARLVVRVRAVLATGRNRAPLGAAKTSGIVATALAATLALACTAPTDAVRETSRDLSRDTSHDKSPTPSTALTVARGGAPASEPAAAGSFDPAIQAIADEELDRTLREWSAPAGVIVVLDPSTGRVLADAGRDGAAPTDVARLHAREPGSTMKVVVLAAALDQGLASPTETIDCGNGALPYAGHTIQDSHSNGVLSLSRALAVSSNAASVKLFDRVGGARFEKELRALHFGDAPGRIPEPIEDHSLAGALASFGERITATPLQVAAAYVSIANGGSYIEPSFSAAGASRRERVMKPETAHAVMAMLDEVVNGDDGTGTLARVAGARVAGKTGTAMWMLPGGVEAHYPSFVGIVPEEAPRFVILVGVEQPKDKSDGAGGWNVAAPAFARVATRALAVAEP